MSEKSSIKSINKYAKEKGVVCISVKYKNNKQKLKWKCLTCKYEFYSSKNNFDRYFKHCRNCFYNNGNKNSYTELIKERPYNISKNLKLLNDKISSMDAELLSKYSGSQKNISIKCSNGHVFESKFSNIINVGTWCPECADKKISISENIVRKYFEVIFSDKFPKTRPNWLKNKKTNRNLELDGYCKKLSIAFEHQGPHHYTDTFKTNRLNKTIELDVIKNIKCKENNIKLFIIEHLFKKTKLKDLFSVIKKQADFFGLNISDPGVISIKDCYYDDRILELEEIAHNKGGELLDKEYFGLSNKKVRWKCSKGHVWRQYPYAVKKRSWCPVCAGHKKGTKLGCNIIHE